MRDWDRELLIIRCCGHGKMRVNGGYTDDGIGMRVLGVKGIYGAKDLTIKVY